MVTVLTHPELTPWPVFLSNVFVVLFASAITFLMLNLIDMRQVRGRNSLLRRTVDGKSAYEVQIATVSDLVKQRTISLIVGLSVVAAFSYSL